MAQSADVPVRDRLNTAVRVSVVVPVFNEAEAISAFCQAALAALPGRTEILVCYDFDGDNTLPALAALPMNSKPPGLRLIRNNLGKGVRFAIEAGMRAATSPVTVVAMVDLSDDLSKVEAMTALVEGGATVVSASRYMKGGKQLGGPWFKGLLSRTAGVTLFWLAGVPTHDPTNSFKAYRTEFLHKTPIESTAGFCLAMELTLKAHFAGGTVREIPATWRDRQVGKSRFKLWSWLPTYLYWYLWAIKQRLRQLLHLAPAL
jgi:glycosyltransferase involved in cell wall biosynthesis